MNYKIIIRKAVFIDIDEITKYSFRFTFDKDISQNIQNKLFWAIYSLEFLPERFEEYNENYRRMIVDWKYKIIYRIEEKTKKVFIIRILKTITLDNIS